MGAVFVLMLAAAMGLGVLAAYVRSNPQAARVPDSMRRADPSEKPIETKLTARHEEKAKPEATEPELQVGVPQNSDVVMKPVETTIPEDQDKLVFVGNQIFKAFGKEGARVLRVDVKNGTVTIHCNPKVLGYGSVEEGQMLKSLEMTYGQFPEIKKIELMIDGQKVDTLGSVEITEGLAVIRADDASQVKKP